MASFLITGADGYVGRQLSKSLVESGHSITRLGSLKALRPMPRCDDLASWCDLMITHDFVVHCAGIAHNRSIFSPRSIDDYLAANFRLTHTISKAASISGIKKLIYISSILVNGEESISPFSSSSGLNPSSFYSIAELLVNMLFGLYLKGVTSNYY